ncbi:sulfite exporter TauE/SafE family protein [Acuticoccus kandeliae]|uniref:sulfite exporter TauE/SafE family protein n=1 Tax=Acuticoccus kandeliae TaxID=2073160 RepID=UPI001FE24B5D|nr:sulfite exporter TauE/SafE family protein [Acuticoccus kandeliae]
MRKSRVTRRAPAGDEVAMEILLLAGAGIAGGICNAIAGGGTFFTFPALIAVGIPPVVANATSALSIWPGHAVSLLGTRRVLAANARRVREGGATFAVGSLVGAALLIASGDRVFGAAIPWLILFATALFAGGPALRRHLARQRRTPPPAAILAMEFAAAVYGGYFGAGLGIILLALLTVTGIEPPSVANVLKNALATVATSVAILLFALTGTIDWGAAAIVFAGAAAGGVIGGRLAARVPANALRAIVVAVGLGLAWHYF